MMNDSLCIPRPAGCEQSVVAAIREDEFQQFRELIYRIAGIAMGPAKKPLVASRLMKRVRHYGLNTYGDYFRLINGQGQQQELQIAIDLLTTNETYFFREQKHFDFIRQHILPAVGAGEKLRVWSAACSSGEEAYSVAMLGADVLGSERLQIMASDLSTRVLEQASGGIYPFNRTVNIPSDYLKKYCLRGIGSQDGKLMVDPQLRKRVHFFQHNLTEQLAEKEPFDLILLRNVMIYFDTDTKRRVISNILPRLRSGGYLFISHSESLNDIAHGLHGVQPAVYRKP